MNKSDKEFKEHFAICKHLKEKYPKVFFFSDIAGANLSYTARQKAYSLRSTDGVPDLFIFKRNKNWSLLVLEIKEPNVELLKVDGNWINKHVTKQAKVLEYLENEKIYACFVIGAEAGIKIIDQYMRDEI